MTQQKHKTPRLHTAQPLSSENAAALDKDQTHYIRNVMRLGPGDRIRLFNGCDGEWLGEITDISKKSTTLQLTQQLRPQPPTTPEIHLLFAPIKKQRLDILIEKAVELGVGALHPILTDHTENRHIKPQRIQAQIIEAAEQCERLDIPTLAPITPLKEKIIHWDSGTNILWAAERAETARTLESTAAPCAFLIGPEGGFSDNEYTFLSGAPQITPISLGSNILRAETASLYCLSQIKK